MAPSTSCSFPASYRTSRCCGRCPAGSTCSKGSHPSVVSSSSTSAARDVRIGRSAREVPRTRMDDARAVADAAGIDQAVGMGLSEGGPLALLFATAFPERVRSLVLWGTYARALNGPDYDIGLDPELAEAFISHIRDQWGTGHALEAFLGGIDDDILELLARYERQTASPGAAATILHHNINMDVRYAL